MFFRAWKPGECVNGTSSHTVNDRLYRLVGMVLVATLVSLLVFGLAMLYSTSYATHGEGMVKRQAAWILLGLITGAVLRWTDYRKLGGISIVFLGGVAAALAYLAGAYVIYKLELLPPGLFSLLPLLGETTTKGAFRWLILGPIRIQPSEFAKLAVILFLANYYNRGARHTHALFRGFVRPMLGAGGVIGLVFLGRDLSTAVITGGAVMIMCFVAGVRLRYLALAGIAGLVLVTVMIVSDSERLARYLSYRDPERFQSDDGYQLWNSQLALGSGGWLGRGFTESRMKQHYLPEAHTDFILAIVGEELGYSGMLMTMFGYLVLTAAVAGVGMLAPDRTGLLLCVGIAFALGLQAFVNLSVVSGFMPTTGVTAPLISYGGSSMLVTLAGLGLVLSVLRVAYREKRHKEMGETYTLVGRKQTRPALLPDVTEVEEHTSPAETSPPLPTI